MTRWGPHLNHLRQAQKLGMEVTALNTMLELAVHLNPIADAFLVLDRARTSNGYGPNPLPVSEILGYLDFLGITEYDETDEWLRLIQCLDRVVIEEHNARASTRDKRPKGSKRR